MLEDLRGLRALIGVTPPLPTVLAEAERRLDDDPGHDVEHALRVALWTVRIAGDEVPPRLSIAAALFHDLINLPKNHPERARASVQSAALARQLLAPFTSDVPRLLRFFQLLGSTPSRDAIVGRFERPIRSYAASAGRAPGASRDLRGWAQRSPSVTIEALLPRSRLTRAPMRVLIAGISKRSRSVT